MGRRFNSPGGRGSRSWCWAGGGGPTGSFFGGKNVIFNKLFWTKHYYVLAFLSSPARTEAAAGEGARRTPCRGSAGGLRAGLGRRRRGGLGEKGTGFWDVG